MKKRGIHTAVAALVLIAIAWGAAAASTPEETASADLLDLVADVERVLPESWRVVEYGEGRLPIGWTGPEVGLYVMVEDTGTRFFHPNGFHYYSFYRVWTLPSDWEGEMRHTPYVADSAPAFLLGLGDERVALYHTAGGNVWSEGPSAFCSALGLDTISYNDLTRRVVDLEIEERLTGGLADAATRAKAPAFGMDPYRILGLTGQGPGLYLEYIFGGEDVTDDGRLDDITAQLAGSVFDRFPEVESLYLRRCTRDTFTDTIVNRD